jgi:hypothetical protein
MLRFPLSISILMCTLASYAAGQASVRIEPHTNLEGPRVLEDQTASAAVRDYLQSWHSLSAALEQNRADLLDADFVGTALDKLDDTVQEQAKLGLSAKYQDGSHDIQIVFYSPEGLSLELTDTVEYDMQVFDHGKLLTTQHVHARYVVVITPTESRWKVRIFQAQI